MVLISALISTAVHYSLVKSDITGWTTRVQLLDEQDFSSYYRVQLPTKWIKGAFPGCKVAAARS